MLSPSERVYAVTLVNTRLGHKWFPFLFPFLLLPLHDSCIVTYHSKTLSALLIRCEFVEMGKNLILSLV